MTFAESIRTCFSKYADGKGRATRSEFWYFYLFYVVVWAVVQVADIKILSLATLALIIPNIAASVRRMHDTGRSGWFVLIPINNLILLATPGTVGPNGYDGGSPDEITPVSQRRTGLIMLGISPLIAFGPFIFGAIGAQLFCEGGLSGANEANCSFAVLPWLSIVTLPAGLILAVIGIVMIIRDGSKR